MTIQLPDEMTPVEIVGVSELLPGQNWLIKETIVEYANLMVLNEFPWNIAQAKEPLAVDVGTNGKVISLGHHRWVAAKLAGIAMPYEFEMQYDYFNAGLIVPFACRWEDVHWE